MQLDSESLLAVLALAVASGTHPRFLFHHISKLMAPTLFYGIEFCI